MNDARRINDLIEAGLTEREIAQLVGCSQPSINRYRKGKEPRSSVAEAIRALHESRMPRGELEYASIDSDATGVLP